MPARRAIAVAQIESLSTAALKTLATNLDKLPPASQVLVLHSLAARGERSQLPIVLTAAKSSDNAIRKAGIQALGRLGDLSVIPLLLDTLHSGGELGSFAADSLTQLTSEGVNEKLIAALEAEKTPARIASLIGILEGRKAVAAVPVLLKAARSDTAAVRSSAFAGLRTLAELDHIPEMVQGLLKTEKGKEREQAEQAIVAVCCEQTTPELRSAPILQVLGNTKVPREVLLPVLGRIGGGAAGPK